MIPVPTLIPLAPFSPAWEKGEQMSITISPSPAPRARGPGGEGLG